MFVLSVKKYGHHVKKCRKEERAKKEKEKKRKTKKKQDGVEINPITLQDLKKLKRIISQT